MLDDVTVLRSRTLWMGVALGLGVAVFALASVMVLLRPESTPAGTPPPTEVFDVLPPTPTWTPMPDFSLPTPTPSPAPTEAIVASVPVTPTAQPPAEPLTYTVASGDTLSDIAFKFGVSVDDLVAVNDLGDEMIYVDQVLLIPGDGALLAQATPTPEATEEAARVHTVSAGETLGEIAASYDMAVEDLVRVNGLESDVLEVGQTLVIPTGTLTGTVQGWRPAPVVDGLEVAYPLKRDADDFTLHYAPERYTSRELNALASAISDGIDHLEEAFDAEWDGAFDVYLADRVFAAPYEARRAWSDPVARRAFLLRDGSGDETDRDYFVTYALAPLFAEAVWGPAASAMLREGFAVYAGFTALAGDDYLPLETFCAAYERADVLPAISQDASYAGHLRDPRQHHAAGCFVSYLVARHGLDTFAQLYSSGDYTILYSVDVDSLEKAWSVYLSGVALDLDEEEASPASLVQATAAVVEAYAALLAEYEGTPEQVAAYRQLDAARLALMAGRLADVQPLLEGTLEP